MNSLEAINRELATVLRMEPAQLLRGAEAAERDDLVVCGILGGKDVGKSTLINALAGTEVSSDRAEVGRGTQRPMAYVHRTARHAALQRFEAVTARFSVDVTEHQADAIRNVVLVDLPDFDSEFDEHLDAVRAVAPTLDRVIWVQTPRKIADRTWVSMLDKVIKDDRNVRCVVNKVDLLLCDAEASGACRENGAARARAARFWNDQRSLSSRSLMAAGFAPPDGRLFLIAALYPDAQEFTTHVGRLWDDPNWERYPSERTYVREIGRLASGDFERLRASVLAPIGQKEQRTIKQANRAKQHQVNVERLLDHFELDRVMARLAHACDPDYQQHVLNEAMDATFIGAVAAPLEARMRPDTELADELLSRRIESWPLLRLVYFPLGFLARAAGRRLAGPPRPGSEAPSDPLEGPGPSLSQRIDAIRSRLFSDHGVVGRQVGLSSEMPDAASLSHRVSSAVRGLPARLETRLIEAITQQDRPPSLLARAGLWLLLLWFPFAQPILAGMLEMFREDGTWRLVHGLYRIVTALSAVHLLAGFAVVGVVYLCILSGMYLRALRAVRRNRGPGGKSSAVLVAVDELLAREVVAALVEPFHKRLNCLRALRAALNEPDASGAPHECQAAPMGNAEDDGESTGISQG